MARYRRSDQRELRVADRLETDGREWTVDLIAKKATGVEGWRVTLSFLEIDGPGTRFVPLEPAADREEAERRARELADDPDRLRAFLEDDGA